MKTEPIAIALHGCAGRMGVRLLQLIAADPRLRLAAAIDRPGHPSQGQDAGGLAGLEKLGVVVTDRLIAKADAAIDFSAPAASLSFANDCAKAGIPLAVGTTGFSPTERQALLKHAEQIPILLSANFSKAVNLLAFLAAQAARVLGSDADVEIVERHHHFKKDAPSGTALRLAEVVARELGLDANAYVHGRAGEVGERPQAQIGLHALRTGDNPGEHTVVFGLMGECLELSHRALNRDGFARGAIDAARFLVDKAPRVYDMGDLLGFA